MEFDKKMVSVVIPVYQSKNYLAYCMESVLNQTYKNMEIILVDDGSDDGSEELCEKYSHGYSNIFCIHQNNKGVSSARNTGIDKANGEYIVFVDSDDYIEPEYLAHAVWELENEQADMYLCGYQSVTRNGAVKEIKYYPSINDGVWKRDEMNRIVMRLFNSSTLHAIGTKVYKKSIIKKNGIRFNREWNYFEDIYFCLSYLAHCTKIAVQNKIMYYYRRDVCNSLSKQNKNYKYRNIHKTYELLYQLINGSKTTNKDRELFYKSYLQHINLCLNSKAIAEKRYTVNMHKLYKKLSKDQYYIDSVPYAGKAEKTEYFCVKRGFCLGAYFIRNYWKHDK